MEVIESLSCGEGISASIITPLTGRLVWADGRRHQLLRTHRPRVGPCRPDETLAAPPHAPGRVGEVAPDRPSLDPLGAQGLFDALLFGKPERFVKRRTGA